MSATVASVRACSFSGEFDSLSEAVIGAALDEVRPQYSTLKSETGASTVTVDKLVSLHAAHLLHVGLKQEASGGDEPGPVKSESLDRVGSRSYGSAAKLDGQGGIVDWQDSPYGRRHQAIWTKLPPGAAVVGP